MKPKNFIGNPLLKRAGDLKQTFENLHKNDELNGKELNSIAHYSVLGEIIDYLQEPQNSPEALHQYFNYKMDIEGGPDEGVGQYDDSPVQDLFKEVEDFITDVDKQLKLGDAYEAYKPKREEEYKKNFKNNN